MPRPITPGRFALVLASLLFGGGKVQSQLTSPGQAPPAPRRRALQLDRAVKIVCEVDGGSTLLQLAAHSSRVKQGDVICELDSSALREYRDRQKIATTQAQQALHDAEADLNVARIRDIEARNSAAAKLDLAKSAVEVTRGAEALAQREFDLLAKTLPPQDGKRINARLRLTRATSRRTTAESQLASLSKISQEQNKGLQLQFERFELTVAMHQSMLKLEQTKLDKLEDQVGKCTIHAPCDGLVMIAAPSTSTGSPVAEGEIARTKQHLMSIIPDPAVRTDP
jgi:multidrug resistance efflux pump